MYNTMRLNYRLKEMNHRYPEHSDGKQQLYHHHSINNGKTRTTPTKSANITSIKMSRSKLNKKKRRSWKKPEGKPARPLSAYNFFFRHERNRLVTNALQEANEDLSENQLKEALKVGKDRPHRKLHGTIDFSTLTKMVSVKWKSILPSEKVLFKKKADADTERYRQEVDIWKARQSQATAFAPMSNPLLEIIPSNTEIIANNGNTFEQKVVVKTEDDKEHCLEEFGNLQFFPVFQGSDSNTNTGTAAMQESQQTNHFDYEAPMLKFPCTPCSSTMGVQGFMNLQLCPDPMESMEEIMSQM